MTLKHVKLAKHIVRFRPSAHKRNRYRRYLTDPEVKNLLSVLKHLRSHLPKTSRDKPVWLF